MRILMYSPDSYGLGHVKRSISLAHAALSEIAGSSVYLLTGAPRAHYFDYPPGCDFLKLLSVSKDIEGRYVPRDLDLSLKKTIRLRGRLIKLAADSFKPHVLLVDHSPLGLCGEIVPILRRLERRRPDALRVLGMRDVIDEPDAVKAAWKRDGVLDVLHEGYHKILVYGQRELFDPIEAYDIPEAIARKMEFVGYIPRNGRRADPQALRTQYAPRTGRLVAVTLGGGGDGNLLLRACLQGYERLGDNPPFEVVAVTGPLMSPGKRKRFKAWAGRMPGLSLVDYVAAMPDLLDACDFAVSMGGYNTVCELACARARALIVPRTFPRKEQLIRARFLAERGMAQCLADREPDPDTLMRLVLEGLERPAPPRGWGLEFTGPARAVEALNGREVGATRRPGRRVEPSPRTDRSWLSRSAGELG